MRSSIGVRSFCAALLILGARCAVGVGQAPVNWLAVPSRIAGPIDESRLVTLEGNVHPLARAEFDRGLVSAETELGRMVLVLEPSAGQQAELDALVAAQLDPHSPLYRQWLTPAQFGARFGVSAEDAARVAAWLDAHGFTVEEIPASNRLMVFSGTAGQVAETFHTGIHRYLVDGMEHIANSGNPQVPAALAGVVGGVVSLHDFRRRSEIKARTAMAVDALLGEQSLVGAQPFYTSGSTHYLFPADWAAIYDLNSLYSAGTAGTGISIAIAGRSNIAVGDVAAFRTAAGLAANNPAVILAGADPGLVGGDQDEATLDVEWSGAVAPAAAVELVVGESAETTDGVDLAAEYIVNHDLAQVVSTSYGSCEQEMGTVELAFYNGLWEQAASQGMSAFVASGDAGAAGCYEGSSALGSGTAVNGLCTSPYATCVGGTEFNEGSNPAQYWAGTNAANYGTALSYIPEEVWNESALDGGTGLWASGGGASVVYPQPGWQKAVMGTSAANGMRSVPDVAVTAAAHDGYVVYENGSYHIFSGTSIACSAFAGVMALVVERQGGAGIGSANPGLYALLSAAHSPFHATPSGNNSVPGVTGFTASGAEYNLATGLGSVDGALLVEQWGEGSGGSAPTLALTAGSSAVMVVEGGSSTVSFSAATGGSFSGVIGFSVTGLPEGVTAAWSANPLVAASGVGTNLATLTLTASATAIPGSATMVATAAGDGLVASQSVALQVQTNVIDQAASSDFTIQTAGGTGSSATVLPGGSVTESFTVSPADGAGALTNAIALTASGLPAGATAVFSPASVAAGSGTTTVTLAIQLPQASPDSEWAGGSGGGLAPLSLALLFLPLAGRLRRGGRRIGRLIPLLVLVGAGLAATAGLNGCGSVSGPLGQSAQTYIVTVTGTSGVLSHSATITLTVE